jgi:uncharacterized protein (DUF58 family)
LRLLQQLLEMAGERRQIRQRQRSCRTASCCHVIRRACRTATAGVLLLRGLLLLLLLLLLHGWLLLRVSSLRVLRVVSRRVVRRDRNVRATHRTRARAFKPRAQA